MSKTTQFHYLTAQEARQIAERAVSVDNEKVDLLVKSVLSKVKNKSTTFKPEDTIYYLAYPLKGIRCPITISEVQMVADTLQELGYKISWANSYTRDEIKGVSW